MSNLAITLSKRLRARTVSLPITPTQHAVCSKPLSIYALKRQTADWEPAVPLPRLKTASMYKDGDDDGANVAHVITYSSFDPGATHPLLLSSVLPLWSPSVVEDTSIVSSLISGGMAQCKAAGANPALQKTSTVSSLHLAIKNQRDVPVLDTEKLKLWPYSLPKVLQPQAGTTYALMYGDAAACAQTDNVKPGMLQSALYGVPEPDEANNMDYGAEEGFWQKVVRGAQGEEEEGKAGF